MTRRFTRSAFVAFGAAPAALALGAGPAAAASVDLKYVKALQCADQFLEAWSKRDATAGLAVVSSRAKEHYHEAVIHDWLVGTSSPMNTSFEIGDGRALGMSRYRFSVKLYYYLTGGGLDVPKAQILEIALENGAWKADVLPI